MPTEPRSDRSYVALLERLFAARRFGAVLGVERVAELATRLGSPEQSIKTRVVVAGTNGKGSTVSALEAIATAAKRKTGAFTSPHLARLSERFRINGEEASRAAITAAFDEVSAVGGAELTFFEQCTAAALVLFREAAVDLAIFEVGLGGRLDATRIAQPHLVVVTGVAFDHTDVLGATLEEIAREKIGAANPGTPAIIGRGGVAGSLEALLGAAANGGVPTTVAEATTGLKVGLPGPFQEANAACAAAAARALGFSSADIGEGLARARMPGRFETLASNPGGLEFIVDGAHNEQGAQALAAALAALPPRETIVVLAVSADKDAARLAAPLLAGADAVWVSRASSDRAMKPSRLAAIVASLGGGDAEIVSMEEICARLAALDRPVRCVAAGSLLFIGELRARFLGEPLDPVVLSDPAVRGSR